MGLRMLSAKINAIDLVSHKEKTLHTIENSRGFYINELTALPDKLFWVQSKDGQVSIEEMNLDSGKIRTVESYDGENDILLQTDGKYLTWFLINGDKTCLKVYDTEKSDLFILSEDIETAFPYARANVVEGICSFPTKEYGKTVIKVLDLETRAVINCFELEQEHEIFNIVADKQRCLYSLLKDGAPDWKIHVFNYSDKTEDEINSSEEYYVFSWQYPKGKLFINERNTNSIIIHDVSTGDETAVSDNDYHLFILDGITGSGKYFVQDMADYTKPVIYSVDIES